MSDKAPPPQSVVVPVEPTEAMLKAGNDRTDFARVCWEAMLAAAPAPSSLAGRSGLAEFEADKTGVQSRYVIVHQLRASADIQDNATKRETGWATTSDRAELMRRAADAIERLAALSPEAPRGTSTATPGGCLVKDHAGGWFWTPTKMAAVAALTEGHKVYSISRGEYEGAPFTDNGAEERYITDSYELSPEAPARDVGDLEGLLTTALTDELQDGGAEVPYSIIAERVAARVADEASAPSCALTVAAEEALSFLQNAPLESGICCCGDPVSGHGYGSGHSPVDDLEYHSSQVAEKLQAALTPSHEAPAELLSNPQELEAPAEGAGEEDEDGDVPWPDTALSNALHKHFSELHGLTNEDASDEVRGVLDVIKALRARSSAPEAREGEGPIGPVFFTDSQNPEDRWVSQSYPDGSTSIDPAAPSADKLRIDLWWNAEDWETTFDNIEDAYEAATGGYCLAVARLGRATEHDAVWAAMIDIDTTGDGEADDREIRLFATEDEARQALAALKGDAKCPS